MILGPILFKLNSIQFQLKNFIILNCFFGNLTLFLAVGLSEAEIAANAFIFVLAGYETIRTGLAMLLYCLASNPECQHKVMEEIDSILGDKVNLPLSIQILPCMGFGNENGY